MKNLSDLKDEEIVRMIQKGRSVEKCLRLLIDRHSGLCINVVNSYTSSTNQSFLRLDLLNEKDHQIYQAALKYKFNKKTKFSTFLGNEVKWKCLNAYNSLKRKRLISIDTDHLNFLNFSENDSCDQKNKNQDFVNFIINNTNNHPDKRVGRIFYLRYIIGKNNSVMPWKYISKDLGMSIQGCINIHDMAIKNIQHKIRKEVNE